ncbi:hypothetical protein RB653_006180 [Dictyostelium firmibasis]|uniref:Uncharacterized protein n=1 Tax=Dictyostelium firmibasis TaxID=79012 RepID=A0AAN7U9B8_9MYCE
MSILNTITKINNCSLKNNRNVEINQNQNNTNNFQFNKVSARCKSYYNPHRWLTFWTF